MSADFLHLTFKILKVKHFSIFTLFIFTKLHSFFKSHCIYSYLLFCLVLEKVSQLFCRDTPCLRFLFKGWPTSPHVNVLTTGLTRTKFNSFVKTSTCFLVKGWSHMSVFMAGQKRTSLLMSQALTTRVWLKRNQEIIADTVWYFCERICCERCDQHDVGPFPKLVSSLLRCAGLIGYRQSCSIRRRRKETRRLAWCILPLESRCL